MQLCRHDLRPCDVKPLLVTKIMGEFYVVYGNRRLKALKHFQEQCQDEVEMNCIVHDYDGAHKCAAAGICKICSR